MAFQTKFHTLEDHAPSKHRMVQLLSISVILILVTGNALAIPGWRQAKAQVSEMGTKSGQPVPIAEPQAPTVGQAVTNALNDQVLPEVAYNSAANNYFAVWENHQFDPDWDIYGAILAADGTPNTWVDITYESTAQQVAPDVAYNSTDNEYMIVWEDATYPTDHDIMARRVSSTGSQAGGWINVSNLSIFESRPVIAYNPTLNQYLVVWEERLGVDEFVQHDVVAQRLDASGNHVGGLITLDSSLSDQSNPAVVYNVPDNLFLVVWQDRNLGNYDIMGRTVSGTGALGSEIPITGGENDQTEPDVASDNIHDSYFVVWQDQHFASSDWDIEGWLVDPVHVITTTISASGTERRMFPKVSYAGRLNEYMVVFQFEYRTDPQDEDVWGSQIGFDGSQRKIDFIITNAGVYEGHPAVASNIYNNYLVIWEDGRDSTTSGIDLYDLRMRWNIYLPILLR